MKEREKEGNMNLSLMNKEKEGNVNVLVIHDQL